MPLWVWLVIAGFVGGAGVYGILVARRRMKESEDLQRDFSLEELRTMRADGRLTEVEYQSARRVVIERSQRALSDRKSARQKGVPPRPSGR